MSAAQLQQLQMKMEFAEGFTPGLCRCRRDGRAASGRGSKPTPGPFGETVGVRDMEVRLRQVSFCGSDYRAYVIRSVIRRSFMPESVADLEQQRAAVLRQISELEDFRAGSITGT